MLYPCSESICILKDVLNRAFDYQTGYNDFIFSKSIATLLYYHNFAQILIHCISFLGEPCGQWFLVISTSMVTLNLVLHVHVGLPKNLVYLVVLCKESHIT